MKEVKVENITMSSIAELLEEETQKKFPLVADCHHPNVYYVDEDEEK